jgi:hypothetical protein
MFDLFRPGIIGEPTRDAQRGNSAALIGFNMKDGQAFAPPGPRSARADSGLLLQITCAIFA